MARRYERMTDLEKALLAMQMAGSAGQLAQGVAPLLGWQSKGEKAATALAKTQESEMQQLMDMRERKEFQEAGIAGEAEAQEKTQAMLLQMLGPGMVSGKPGGPTPEELLGGLYKSGISTEMAQKLPFREMAGQAYAQGGRMSPMTQELTGRMPGAEAEAMGAGPMGEYPVREDVYRAVTSRAGILGALAPRTGAGGEPELWEFPSFVMGLNRSETANFFTGQFPARIREEVNETHKYREQLGSLGVPIGDEEGMGQTRDILMNNMAKARVIQLVGAGKILIDRTLWKDEESAVEDVAGYLSAIWTPGPEGGVRVHHLGELYPLGEGQAREFSKSIARIILGYPQPVPDSPEEAEINAMATSDGAVSGSAHYRASQLFGTEEQQMEARSMMADKYDTAAVSQAWVLYQKPEYIASHPEVSRLKVLVEGSKDRRIMDWDRFQMEIKAPLDEFAQYWPMYYMHLAGAPAEMLPQEMFDPRYAFPRAIAQMTFDGLNAVTQVDLVKSLIEEQAQEAGLPGGDKQLMQETFREAKDDIVASILKALKVTKKVEAPPAAAFRGRMGGRGY